MGERTTIEGTVENVVFQNQENGYTVLSLLTDQGEVATVVGCIPFAAAGESMTVTGVWVNHPTYGPQMTAELVERRMPQDEDGIVCYLASGVLKGVGPATATRWTSSARTPSALSRRSRRSSPPLRASPPKRPWRYPPPSAA